MLKTRIVIYCSGGVVQEVATPDDPSSVQVILGDYDFENLDLDDEPVCYFPVTPISEVTYNEYVKDIGRTVEEITDSSA